MVTLGLVAPRTPVIGRTDVVRPHHRGTGSAVARAPLSVRQVTRGGIEKVPRPNGRPPTTATGTTCPVATLRPPSPSTPASAAASKISIGNDGPCSCCSAFVAAWVYLSPQAAQWPIRTATTVDIGHLVHPRPDHHHHHHQLLPGTAAVPADRMQITEPAPSLLYKPTTALLRQQCEL